MKASPEELAGLYVLDQLDRDERAAFEARLLREPELAALTGRLESGLARGIRSLPPREPPAGTLDQIEARIDAPGAALVPAAPPDRAARRMVFARWGLAAMIALSLVTLAVQSLRRTPAQPVIVLVGLYADRNTFTELPLRASARDSDARFIQLATLAENYWGRPGALPAGPEPAAGGNRGYALFDPGSRQGFIAIERLPVAAENQRYHLWILDPAGVHDAGILPLAGMNRGLYSFTLGPADGPKSDRPNFFITVEENGPAGQPAQPRGKVVLGQESI
jgi:anti-sigma-K factor RskA